MAEPVNLCDKHTVPYAYTSEVCPMCRFLEELRKERDAVYKEGFIAGVEAQKKEQELADKAARGKKSDDKGKDPK